MINFQETKGALLTKPRISGSILVFLGAVCWSLNSPLIKYLSLDPFFICGGRSMIAAIALCPFIRHRQLKWNGWTFVYVISYAALCVSLVQALSMTAAPVAIGMQYSAAVWLFLVSFLKTKQFRIREFIPICIIMLGVMLFIMSGTDAKSNTGNLIALSEGVFFAVMTVSAKRAAGSNPLGLTALANIFTAAVIFAAFPEKIITVSAMTGRDWGVMLVLGAVQVGLGYGLYTMGVQLVSPRKASILALWEMILGPVWVALFLKEYPNTLVLTGFVIIIAGMVLDATDHKAENASFSHFREIRKHL